MTKTFSIVLIIVVIALVIFAGFMFKRSKVGDPINPNPSTGKEDIIRLETPKPNEVIQSPLVVRGEARGIWYFEASFPVRLYDANGKELAVNVAQAQGEWMTTEFVPFETKLIFTNPLTETGTLVLQKDNPSGLPEHDDELRIPVRFVKNEIKTRIIKLYFYNESKDKDLAGNLMCTEKGLDPVQRDVPLTISPVQDAIKLLLQGDLTFHEKNLGISTEFPLAGLELRSASLVNGVLTLNFVDPQNRTVGGSCRVNILRAQIEATAKQFGGVSEVHFSPDSIFQP